MATAKTKKFKKRSRGPNTSDNRGIVTITVRLRESGTTYKKGNVTKTISVNDAKVSEIVRAIEGALFAD